MNSSMVGFEILDFMHSDKEPNLEDMERIEKIIKSINNFIIERPEEFKSKAELFLSFFKLLLCDLKVLKIAEQGGNLLQETERLKVLYKEFKFKFSNVSDSCFEKKNASKLDEIESFDRRFTLGLMKEIPFQTSYLGYSDFMKNFRQRSHFREETTDMKGQIKASPLVKIIAYLDNDPLVSVKRIKPNKIYSLKLAIRGRFWPENAKNLSLDFISSCPSDQYSLSKYILEKPSNFTGMDFEETITGEIQFKTGQSITSDNLCFIISPLFNMEEGQKKVKCIGTNQLYFKVRDSDLSPYSSGYNKIDQHIISLLDELSSSDIQEDEIQDLVPLLSAITNLVGTYTQSAIFKETSSVAESSFQKEVLRDLRIRLGQEVEEHTKQVGGFTDLKYKGIVIELKVEKENGDRHTICTKYTKQPTQYQGVEAKQVSIVIVLDLTEKVQPPGDIRNDVLLVDVETHGGKEKKFPSKAIVFVINGNIKSPSEYSR